MGSYYQPMNYTKGGRRKRTKKSLKQMGRLQIGGFYPSIMGGVMSAGKMLIAASLKQGYSMLTSKSIRGKNRKNKTRKVRSK